MIKKKYLKRGVVKVDFILPDAIAADADSAYLVGDFNNWDEQATPMTQLKSGSFKITLDLEPNREYQFRYLVNGNQWQNDPQADGSAVNPFGGVNSILTL